ncbi:MAG: hypothetical protein Q8941_08790 [Bacteroidota bacterium]|nr:hypothetical protein [Bacteroidota bacterium]
MKLKFTQIFIGITLCMLMQSSASFAAGIKNEDPKEKKETKKARVSTSRNNSSVRIYPDIVKRVMHVVAKDNEGTGIDFFVFDLDGTIIKHYKMQSGDHQKLTNLDRGKYIFRVFSGDEETAMGNIEIR